MAHHGGATISSDHDMEKGLHRTDTSVTMPPELFEKLYLTPKVPMHSDYNRRFANPTALGFVGFVISTFTFAMVLMGWGGAEGASPVVGIFFFVGPVLLTFAMVFEWIMGNFFPTCISTGRRPRDDLPSGVPDNKLSNSRALFLETHESSLA
ncbi:Uu.00g135320.m01.CDS01 [Anthostomella pinea]|uniref:Uu.00g135320.m01.CDS01 n=1 Tax=Anthostomella pinea TaxID=933095 RepID=A0AAI8YKV9_9PEZI|nr:Uu.00g135320.m01.CDS01 [Anthostomella pinea]